MKAKMYLTGSLILLLSCGKTAEEKTVPVVSVQINKSSIELNVGGSFTLTAEVKPMDATNKQVTWTSSNSSVAKVEKGLVTAISPGATIITARSGGVSSACSVSVIQPVSRIILNIQEKELIVGEQIQIEAVVEPANASSKSVEWSSADTSVATVENGLVTAISEGATIIKAKNGNVVASCNLTVHPYIPVSSLRFNVESVTLEMDTEYQMTATIEPYNASYKTILWSSSDESVVAVDQNGLLRTYAVGGATIYAKAEEYEVSCEISVVPSVREIVLNKENLYLVIGQKEQLQAHAIPENGLDKTFVWKSSNEEVAVVDETGVVQALQKGHATITVTCGDLVRTCNVEVYIGIDSIEISPGYYRLKEGQYLRLTAFPSPHDAYKTVFWNSTDESIISIVESGFTKYPNPIFPYCIIKAVKEGKAYIEAKAPNDVLSRVEITVSNNIDGDNENVGYDKWE